MAMDFRDTIISNNIQLTQGVYLLSFNRWFDFKPGQVVSIRINNQMAGRLYSICSSSKNSEAQILYKVRPEGLLTPNLATLKEGDTVQVSEPFGDFINQNTPSVFIATGTGIAPFMSMMLSGCKLPEKIIYGTSDSKFVNFDSQITELIGSDNFVKCISRHNNSDSYFGRVTDYVDSTTDLKNIMYYLCGNPNMVVDVRDLLIKKGVSFNNIMSEIYF